MAKPHRTHKKANHGKRPANAKARKAPDTAAQQAPAWGAPPTPSAAQPGVPWANEGANTPPQATPATGPAWLNT